MSDRNHVKVSGYFWAYELACSCCGRLVLQPRLLDVLDEIRIDWGSAIMPTSGCRCMLKNEEIYRKKNEMRIATGLPKMRVNKSSPHLIGSAPQIIDKGGWAADLPIVYDMIDLDDREQWLADLGVRGAGFGPNFTHFDVKPRREQFRSWIYNSGKATRRTVID
jgi:hypothetical protein